MTLPVIFPPVVTANAPKAKAVVFDGTNDYMSRAAYSGISDGTDGAISFWLKINGSPGVFQGIFEISAGAAPTNSRFVVELSNTLAMYMAALDSTPTQVWQASGANLSTGQWYHVAASWNTSEAKIYIDGSLYATASPTPTGTNIDYNAANVMIGARPTSGTVKLDGELTEVWFSTTYIDLSSSTNMQKFRKSNGKPAFLGSTGQRPMGSTPIVYLKGPASSFATNLGSGGSFSVTGTLTDASTSPSD